MKAIVLLIIRLTMAAIQVIGLRIYVPGFAIHPPNLVRTTAETSCLHDLKIEVNAKPSVINLGQSSDIDWSVSLPSGCILTSVQLNGMFVLLSGNEIVTPSQTTMYHLRVVLDLNGSSVEKTTSVQVIVNHPEAQLFCPYILPFQGVEHWQPNLQGNERHYGMTSEWLGEMLSFPNMLIPLNSEVVLESQSENTREIPPMLAHELPFLSACTFLPVTPGLDLKHWSPEHSHPTTIPPLIT